MIIIDCGHEVIDMTFSNSLVHQSGFVPPNPDEASHNSKTNPKWQATCLLPSSHISTEKIKIADTHIYVSWQLQVRDGNL